MTEHLYLLDGHSLLYRYHHSPFKTLSVPCPECRWGGDLPCKWCGGVGVEVTKATYLFTQFIINLTSAARRPSYLAVCFDGPRDKLIRRNISPAYKQGRGETPPAIIQQTVRVRQIVTALGYTLVESEGYEADDVIATLARRYVSDDVHVRVVSKDKDLLPLLSDRRITIYDPQNREETTADDATAKWGVTPGQITDFLTLVGDASDNIKGVYGVGPEKAKVLLNTFGSVQGVLANLDKLKPALRCVLQDAEESGTLKLARELVTLRTDAPLGNLRAKDLECDAPRMSTAAPLFRLLGFRKWGQT